jgi:2-polyprenyl-3-methyl-5-hydroxy-6-metoxy-1,4-benzoquinol methylase
MEGPSRTKDLHEKYHSKTKSQYKIIGEKNFTYRIIISFVSKHLVKKQKILDIGCGAGTLDFYLADKGNNVTGIDISQKAIESCRKTADNLKIKNVEFKRVNFPKEAVNGKFDFIIFSEVIEHLADDKKALREIYKLLNPGGILFLTTPSINAPLHRLGLTKKFDKEVGHLRRYELNSLLDMIGRSGFEIVEVRKTEGIIRNFLFINPIAGKFVRFIKFFISDLVTMADNFTIPIFGESNYIVVARKK